MKNGAPPPEPILTRPKLLRVSGIYYEAYQQLSRSRQIGQGGEFYIPHTEFEAFFNIKQVRNPEVRMRYVRIIQQVDDEVLQFRCQQREAEMKKAK